VSVPEGLGWWRSRPGGADWLDRLPEIVRACAARWSLEVGSPFEPATISYVAPVRLPDGADAVLKVNFPEPESEREPEALRLWDGRGAVRLLASDRAQRALLVERCVPGTTLWEIVDEDEADRIAAHVLRLLWRPAPAQHPFRLLADEAARWADELPGRWERAGRPCERGLLDEAVAFLRVAGPDQGEQVVLHQDFHGGNVLRAEREPWLAIDPKPLAGERELDVASLLRDRRDELARDPAPARRVRRCLDLLAAELDLDRERMRGWGIAHALAWGLEEDGADEAGLSCAQWLSEA
jgi:streptomycin 6-kinase